MLSVVVALNHGKQKIGAGSGAKDICNFHHHHRHTIVRRNVRSDFAISVIVAYFLVIILRYSKAF